MCLKIDKTLIGMGLTTGDIPTPRVSALMRLKTQKFPQMSVHTSAHTYTFPRASPGTDVIGSLPDAVLLVSSLLLHQPLSHLAQLLYKGIVY